MNSFWKREDRRLESELRSGRPRPSDDLVRSIERRVEARRPTGVPRLALAGGMTVVMVVALGSVGGISYAANAAKSAARVVQKAVAPTGNNSAIKVLGITAGGDQYRPGFGFGDRNHNHTGPPGLQRRGGEAAPPIRAQRSSDRKARLVSFTVNIDEQAVLHISVVGAGGKKILLSQTKGANVGAGISGPQTKSIRYTVLVPRAIPIALRIPANLLRPGQRYTVQILATDPDGNKITLRVPFIA